MTKTIDTLVSDIYNLFDKDVIVQEQETQELGQRISKHLQKGLTKKSEGAGLWMSNFGKKCKRQLWYKINKPELAEPLRAPAKIKFFIGHLLEEILLWLAEKAGHKVEGMQDYVYLEGLSGKRDAIIDGHLVDVKSASTRSFDKFSSHLTSDNDSFGYIDQLDAYLEASKNDDRLHDKLSGSFLVIDKTLGNIVLDKHPKLDVDYKKKIDEVRTSTQSKDPPQRYFDDVPEGKSGNRKLGTECSYCEFKFECWKHSNKGQGLRTFFYSNGPKYLTHVAREPRVNEGS